MVANIRTYEENYHFLTVYFDAISKNLFVLVIHDFTKLIQIKVPSICYL